MLTNKSPQDLISGTAQAEPVLSRIIEINAPQAPRENFAQNAEILATAIRDFKENPGFLAQDVIDFVLADDVNLAGLYAQALEEVTNMIGENSLNGRNNAILALYYASAKICENLWGVKPDDDFFFNLIWQYSKTEAQATDEHLDVLHQASNLLSKNLKIKGFYAANESDLYDKKEAEEIIFTAGQKQEYRAAQISEKNRQNGWLGALAFAKIHEFDLSTFFDAKYFMLTKSGIDRAERMGVNLSGTIDFCLKNGFCKVNKGSEKRTLGYKDKDIGNVICFDLEALRANLKG